MVTSDGEVKVTLWMYLIMNDINLKNRKREGRNENHGEKPLLENNRGSKDPECSCKEIVVHSRELHVDVTRDPRVFGHIRLSGVGFPSDRR